MLTSPAIEANPSGATQAPAAQSESLASGLTSTNVGATRTPNRSNACGSISNSTADWPMSCCTRAAVWRIEAFCRPRSMSTACARAAWSMRSRRVRSGMPSVTNTSNAGRSVTSALAPNACRFASYARARPSTSTRPFGCGIASTLTADCEAAARSSSAAEGIRYFCLAASTSVSVGCRYCCLARSISCSVGSRTCADAPIARRNEPTARITLKRTAVPLPEQEIREVLALNRVLLPGAPDNRCAAKGLTAPAVEHGGVGNRIGHLRLVGALVHDRVGHRTAERISAVIAPGHELPMHLARQALRDQHRGLHPADVGRD